MSTVLPASLAREDPWVPPSALSVPPPASTPTSGILPGGFTVGEYVRVDQQYNCGSLDSQGGLGYINAMSGAVVSVFFPVDNCTETGVLLSRLHHAIGAAPKRKAAPAAGTMGEAPTKQPKETQLLCPVVAELMTQGNRKDGNPLVAKLARGASRKEGWRRLEEWKRVHGSGEPPGKQFTPEEKLLFAVDHFLILGSPGMTTEHLGHAWGRNRNASGRAARDVLERLGPQRAVDSRAGRSVLDDPEFAKSILTAEAEYVSQKQLEAPTAGGGSFTRDLRAEFQAMPDEQKLPYEQLAELKLLRQPHVQYDLHAILVRTGGNITWEALAAHTGGLAGAMAVRRWVMNQEGFEYCSSTLMPTLSQGQQQLRLEWARRTIAFWLLARLLKIKILLVHSDEKW